jgi:putative ABC transport system permease protein
MFRNYLIIAYRHLLKNRIYALLNITGMAAGISCCILIYLYISSEVSFDNHWQDYDRIFRITQTLQTADTTDPIAYTSFSTGPSMKEYYAGITDYVRLMPLGKETIWKGTETHILSDMFLTDTSFFSIFNIPLIYGNRDSLFLKSNSIVLSQEAAKLIFGDTNPVGKILDLSSDRLTVTGVMGRPAGESHLIIKALIPINILNEDQITYYRDDWMKLAWMTYIKVNQETTRESLETNLPGWYNLYVKPWITKKELKLELSFHIQPVSEIHFCTRYKFDISTNTTRANIYLFGSIAVFILIIACINYVNMATSRYSVRAKEVAIRKTIGGNRRDLIIQFIGESFLITLISVLLAFVLTELSIPFFNEVAGKELSFLQKGVLIQIAGLSVAIILFVSFLAGVYPAFYLSTFYPAQILKGHLNPIKMLRSGNGILGGSVMRRILVIFQFAITLIMISGTIFIFEQTRYMKKQDLGFNQEGLIAIQFPFDTALIHNTEQLKKSMLDTREFEDAAFAYTLPGVHFGRLLIFVDRGHYDEEVPMNFILVDFDFLRMLDIEILQGRGFSKTYMSDTSSSFILNESAAKKLGIGKPVGQKLRCSLADGKVIGVVKDFHYASLHHTIDPLVILVSDKYFRYMVLKIKPGRSREAINEIRTKWYEFAPMHPLEYFYLNEKIDQHYKNEQKVLTIVGYFSLLTILISILGLTGLVSFHLEQRRREIGIRKILGSTATGIMLQLVSEYSRLILISLIPAIPLTWYLVHTWLKGFAFRTTISAWPFVIATIGIFIISIAVVLIKSFRATRTNPAEIIKYE